MKWEKLGKIFEPCGDIEWMYSHAAVPFIDKIDNHNFKLFFTARNKKNISYVGYIIIDEKFKVIDISREPVISPGGLGMFDEQGVTASYVINVNEKKYLYYVGWNQGNTTPFRNAIGLAISSDGGRTYQKYSDGPIVDRSPVDPCFVAGTCVMYENNQFKMWYISCVRWEIFNNRPRHYYHLKYATSDDGINWIRDGQIVIDFKSEYEYAVSQPWVIKDGDIYKMWFSYRAQQYIKTYRIGYAESVDGIKWIRKDDESGIDVSIEGWDSEMICYPFVFDLNNNRYMLYNGNEYGKTGIGLAILDNC